MIAVETNILLYAHRADSPCHGLAKRRLQELASSRETWAIPWPCVHEFLSVATNTRALRPPSTMESALRQIEVWLDRPNLVCLGETAQHWRVLEGLLRDSGLRGAAVHDARIAALCLEHKVSELWTADRGFARFAELRTWNPVEESQVHDHGPAYAAAVRARAAGRRRALAKQRAR